MMMKTLLLSPFLRAIKKGLPVLLFLFSLHTSHAQQVTLFDMDNDACAYIDFEKAGTIFLWDGTPVAYLACKKKDICVYGFNGKFLGWYTDGVLYDNEGYMTGARKTALAGIDMAEPKKGRQKFVPLRKLTQNKPLKPVTWQQKWSETILKELLQAGTE